MQIVERMKHLDNLLGPLSQDNEVVDALDNSISNQDNNIAVSQDLLADNDCNGTGGNDVSCITTVLSMVELMMLISLIV